jgi:hypothetical protein
MLTGNWSLTLPTAASLSSALIETGRETHPPNKPFPNSGVSYAFGERDGDSNREAPPSSSMSGDLLAGDTEGGGRGFP